MSSSTWTAAVFGPRWWKREAERNGRVCGRVQGKGRSRVGKTLRGQVVPIAEVMEKREAAKLASERVVPERVIGLGVHIALHLPRIPSLKRHDLTDSGGIAWACMAESTGAVWSPR